MLVSFFLFKGRLRFLWGLCLFVCLFVCLYGFFRSAGVICLFPGWCHTRRCSMVCKKSYI